MANNTLTGNMTRRAFLNVSVMTAAGAALGVSAPLGASVSLSHKDSEKPNILMVLTDDQHYKALGCMGHPIIQTPHLDALAADGVLFQNSYATSSTCWSSRASIFLGQYPQIHGLFNPQDDLEPTQWSGAYPELLRQAGYHTGYIGKFGVGFNPSKSAFDVYQGLPGDTRYMQRRHGQKRHVTPILTDQAAAFLADRPVDRPFCLTVGMKAPHIEDYAPQPFPAEADFEAWYQGMGMPKGPLHSTRYFDELPDFLKASESRRRFLHHFGETTQAQEALRNYYRLISGVDRAVGTLQDQLEQLGLADNTVIVFTSDNGYCTGERGLEGKWLAFEDALRTPLIIADPRNRKLHGRKESATALNIDLPVTILGLAGLTTPESMQGVDLMANADMDDTPFRRDWIFANHYAHPGIPQNEGLRCGDWKYVQWQENGPSPQHGKRHESLYNLAQDPHETRNLADGTAPSQRLAQMRNRLGALRA